MPLYSAPEVFDGKPSPHSDQYSLAIVYGEMLTGALPFQPGNPAWIVQQHRHGTPDLSSLPERQRPVIARALSKSPVERYATCTAMIAALEATLAEDAAARTLDRDSRGGLGDRHGAAHVAAAARAAAPGPAARRDGASAAPPALFIGLGGAAAEVLARLAGGLHERALHDNAIRQVHLVLIDTDGRSLAEKFVHAGETVHLLPIFLQTTEAYGPRSADILNWLGRRWFYNLPRDRSTGGFRPLGRLALVTEADRVREIIRAALDQAAAVLPAQSNAQPPRVFIVSSLGGGTGSGALIDVAYLVRTELKSRGLPDDAVHGVLLHSTPPGNAERDKVLANAFATLHELVHFSRPGNRFPGERSLGVRPFGSAQAPFSRTHLLHLGDALGRDEWDIAVESAAGLLDCSAFAAASPLLEGQRPSAAQPGCAGASPTARSYSLLSFGAGMNPVLARIARRSCGDVVKLWRDGLRPPRSSGHSSRPAVSGSTVASGMPAAASPLEAEVVDSIIDFRLAVEDLRHDALDALAGEVGCNAEEYVRQLVDDGSPTASKGRPGKADQGDALLAKINRVLHCPDGERADAGLRKSLFARVTAQLAERAAPRAESFVESIRKIVDVPALRIDGAWKLATTAIKLLQQMHKMLTTQPAQGRGTEAPGGKETVARDQEQRGKSGLFGWAAWPTAADDRRRQFLIGYARDRVQALLSRAVARQIRSIEARLVTLVEQLNSLSQRLVLLSKEFVEEEPQKTDDDGAASAPAGAGPAARYRQMVVEQLELSRDEIACAVEQAIDERVLHGDKGLRRFLDSNCEMHGLLSRRLAATSRCAVRDCLTAIICRYLEASPDSLTAQGQPPLVDLLREELAARGNSTGAGPSERFVIVPQEADLALVGQRLASALPNISIVGGPTGNISLCTVRGEVALEQVARELIGGIDAFEVLASRLHTRIDVEWTPLSGSNLPGTNQSGRNLPGNKPAGDQATVDTVQAPFFSDTVVIPVARK